MAIRVFAALELPETAKQHLRALLEQLGREHPRGVKWVGSETLHLTLKFFASLPEESIPSVVAAIDEAASAFRPIDLALGSLGAFPAPGRPRVLWVGLEGDLDALRRFQADFDRRLAASGFPPEERPFAPHITLGRVREEADREVAGRLAGLVRGEPAGHPPRLLPFRTEEFTLFRSVLGPGGPTYTRLHAARLIGS